MSRAPRVAYSLSPAGPTVTIRARRTAEVVFFVFILLLVLPTLECALLNRVFQGSAALLEALIALAVLPSLTVITAYSLMWQHSGEEIITVVPSALRIRRRIYGPGNEVLLQAVDPASLELTSAHLLRIGARLMFWGLPWQRAIALRSRGRRRLIGNDLSPDEAEEVIRFLRHHLQSALPAA